MLDSVGSTTTSMSRVARGSPCNELATDPVSMYGVPVSSRRWTTSVIVTRCDSSAGSSDTDMGSQVRTEHHVEQRTPNLIR